MKTIRYMIFDRLSFESPGVGLTMAAPDTLSAAELQDVKDWFEIRCRIWERKIVASQGSPSEAEAKP